MVFQDPYSSLNPVRTVGATLARGARRRRPGPRRRARSTLLDAGRAARRTTRARKPVALSGGERQRVAIARALAVRAAAARLRRAGVGARRLGPGADPESVHVAARASSGSATCSSPTTSPSCVRSSTACTSSTAARSSSPARSSACSTRRRTRTRRGSSPPSRERRRDGSRGPTPEATRAAEPGGSGTRT